MFKYTNVQVHFYGCMYLAPVYNLHDSLNKIDYRFLIYGKTLT